MDEIREERRFVMQENAISVDEQIKTLSLLSAKQQVRRTVSNDNQLQQQILSENKHDSTSYSTSLSPVSTVRAVRLPLSRSFVISSPERCEVL